MRHLLLIAFIFISQVAISQKYEELSPKDKAYVDSLVQRKNMIQQSRPHNLMVSFSEGTVNSIEPFFTYLINNGYRTAKGKEVDVVSTKTGYVIKFHKTTEGYEQKELPLTLTITCIGNTDQLKSAVITGNLNLLIDLYLDYFGGHVKEDRPTNGGLDKTYTITDEVRLYSDRITIASHHNILSGK